MIPGADVLRTLAHALFDVTAVSAVLAAVAAIIGRVPGIDPRARSRWWSAVAIVPLVAFAAALVAPAMPSRSAATPAAMSYRAGGALFVDPLDALWRGGDRAVVARVITLPTASVMTTPLPQREPLPWPMFVLALWLAVAVYRLVVVVVSVVRAHRLAVTSSRDVPRAVADIAAAARVGLRARDDLATPVAIGLTRRVVMLPAQLAAELEPGELRAVVLHEIAHLRHRDDWFFLFERLACAVLWFDPFVHVAARASGMWREIACDAAAARSAGSRTCATALWRSASALRTAAAGQPALALLSGGTLVDRVEALLRPSATSRGRTVAASLVLALFASTATAVVMVRVPAYAAPTPAAGVFASARTVADLSPTGSMHTRRASFAFVKLRDGRVLVAGGMIANQNFTNAAEIYDPARGVFEPTGSMLQGRVGLSGTLLPDGRVLVAGGWTSRGLTASAELYDPASGTFSAASPMHHVRGGHSATRLRDGTVLFTGGEESESAPATAEIYDPARGTFTEIGSMLAPRGAYTATLLDDGRVLIAGGLAGRTSVRTTELYDPAARRFIPGPEMLAARSKHGATLLADGSVLITGGAGDYTWRDRLNTAERYDPRSNRFVPAGTMHAKRFKLRDATVRLRNGDVLIAGGSDKVELYDPASDRFRLVDPAMSTARNLGSAVLLDDGSALIAGGYDSVDPLPTTETALRYR